MRLEKDFETRSRNCHGRRPATTTGSLSLVNRRRQTRPHYAVYGKPACALLDVPSRPPHPQLVDSVFDQITSPV